MASIVVILGVAPPSFAGDAPAWMHSLVGVPLPTYDEKTDAVLLYSETNVTVIATDKVRTHVKEAYKIIRPSGRHHGMAGVYMNPQTKVTSLRGWCIPAQGKDFEVKDKDAAEVSPSGIENATLVDDVKYKVLNIPAPDPGNIVGYEYETEERPFFLQDFWSFQGSDPVRESRFTLQLPTGWEYRASWLNYPEGQPKSLGNNRWEWTVNDVKAIRSEPEMPPFAGVVGRMIVSYFSASGQALSNSFRDWKAMGSWYLDLTSDRTNSSPQIKEQVATLTAGKVTVVEKMQAIARFVQHDIRYVAIELGIGGWQPHPATDVFTHRYGDCKDKATLLRTMLREVGVESYHVAINTQRGSVTANTPVHSGFNHVITAIRVPDGVKDPSLVATLQHPKLGQLLFFDPTDEVMPFGQLNGALQANYGLLVVPNESELVRLPQQPSAMNGIQRTAKLTLEPNGTLKGQVSEQQLGDPAWNSRWRLRTVTKDIDRIKPIESTLGSSLTSFRITRAVLTNITLTDQPFGYDYSFEADGYAKNTGDLLLVRPRVIGNWSSGILETKEPRKFAIEFDGPEKDTDTVEITIPTGYEVDDLPAAVDADYGFASYHSKTEAKGNVIRYTRTFEIKELSVPVEKANDLKRFYRIVYGDERSTAVLKPSSRATK